MNTAVETAVETRSKNNQQTAVQLSHHELPLGIASIFALLLVACVLFCKACANERTDRAHHSCKAERPFRLGDMEVMPRFHLHSSLVCLL